VTQDPETIGSGRVLVGGDDWKAIAEDGAGIDRGEAVEVIRIEGNKVFVKRV
jgi:membrane protein implicated in regulation of membrane protease activity